MITSVFGHKIALKTYKIILKKIVLNECGNAEINLKSTTTNEFNSRIKINSLMASWGGGEGTLDLSGLTAIICLELFTCMALFGHFP